MSVKWKHVRNLQDMRRYRLSVSEPCILDYNLRRIYFVVGTFPNDDVELVALASIDDRDLVDPDDVGDMADAVNDGRLASFRCPRDRLLPLPDGAFKKIDRDEVRR